MFLTIVLYIVIFLLTISILVAIHELGHFFIAKKLGIKVLEFGFGIPPRAWGKKIGETILSVNWLPFGGFVRLLGEDEPVPVLGLTGGKGDDSKRYFSERKVGERIGVVVAGVIMNLILAWIIFYIVLFSMGFKYQLPLLNNHKFFGVEQKNEILLLIGGVSKDSPAEAAGIKPGERIISLNGNTVSDSNQLISETKALAGQKIKLILSDQSDNTHSVILTPRTNPPPGQGALGISFSRLGWTNLEYKTSLEKLLSGVIHSLNFASYSFEILGEGLSESFKSHNISPVSQLVSGPLGAGLVEGKIISTSQKPLLNFLDFLAAISLNLAIVNILPFPGLDGGRLLFLLVEAATGRKSHPALEKYIHTVGLVILVSLLILITISDIQKIPFFF